MKKILFSMTLACLSFLAHAQRCTAPPPNLIMHWDFNGTSSEVLNGWTGNVYQHPSTIPTTLTYGPGRDGTPNTAAHFLNHYIQVPYDPLMDLESWTITAIIKPIDFYEYACQGNAVVWRGTQFSNNHYDLQYFDNAFDNDCSNPAGYNPTRDVFAGGAAGTAPFAQSDWLNNPIAPNTTAINPFIVPYQWYCVTAMYNGKTGLMEVYVDNRKVFSRQWPNTYGPATMDDLFIGCSDNPFGLYPYFMWADVDDIRIFNGVFTCPIQMIDLCSCPQNPPLQAVAHWNFNDPNPLVDDVNGLVGTITGGVTQTSGALTTPNTAYQFDGATGMITVPYDPVLDLTSWTIRAVFRPQGFWNGVCEGNILAAKGVQFSGDYYSLLFTDNEADAGCGVYTPASDVLTPLAAGTAQAAAASPPYTAGTFLAGGDNPFLANQWYCVTASYDAVGERIRLFVDGVSIFDMPWFNQYGAPTGANLTIGGQLNATFPYFFNGIIDDIAIYDGAATCPMPCTNALNGLAKRSSSVNNVSTLEEVVLISPNPTSGKIDVTIPTAWKSLSVSIINSVGQVVLSESKPGGGKYQYNMAHLPAGLYLLKVEGDNHSNTQKFIRE